MFKTFKSFQILLIVILIISSLACIKEEDAISYNLKGRPYPTGVKTIDLTAISDCTLPWCSFERITRLELNNVAGYLRLDSILQVTFTFDSVIEFHICNKSSIDFNFETEEAQKVLFSGEAKDACGYLYNGYPFEEEYFINLTKIELL